MIQVEILTAPGCAHCERAQHMVMELVEESRRDFKDLKWKVIDLTQHPELAVKYGVMSTPAIVINGKLEFIGVPNKKKLLEKLRLD